MNTRPGASAIRVPIPTPTPIPLCHPLDAGKTRRIVLTGAVRLSDVRDTITLLDAQGVVVDQVSYPPRGLPAEGRTKVFSN